jgi:hypothetical protein
VPCGKGIESHGSSRNKEDGRAAEGLKKSFGKFGLIILRSSIKNKGEPFFCCRGKRFFGSEKP